MGRRGWRGGDRAEGPKVGLLMLFCDTWSQLIYLVSCMTILFSTCTSPLERREGGFEMNNNRCRVPLLVVYL